jgi:hypothetical protein
VPADRISRRKVPGTERYVSTLGLALDPEEVASPSRRQALTALLRTARAAGVTTFEIGGGGGAEQIERAISVAFPDPDPEITILAERSSAALSATAPRDAAPDAAAPAKIAGSIAGSIARSNDRLRPHRIHFVDWVPSDEDDERSLSDELERLPGSAGIEGVVHRMTPLARRDRFPGAIPFLGSGSWSLLDDRLRARLDDSAERPGFGFFARDPLGSGRLDGSWIAEAVTARRPGSGPVRLRELEQEFAPVLALGFLTQRGHRTLAQAAIRYVIRPPWVCSVLLPLPAPERLAELLATESTPELSPDELARLEGRR